MNLGLVIIVWLLLAVIAALSVALVYYVNQIIEQNDVIIRELRNHNEILKHRAGNVASVEEG